MITNPITTSTTLITDIQDTRHLDLAGSDRIPLAITGLDQPTETVRKVTPRSWLRSVLRQEEAWNFFKAQSLGESSEFLHIFHEL